MADDLRVTFFKDIGQIVTGKSAALPDWEPTPRQRQAMESEADELLYGGAAGGGKSELLLAMGRRKHRRTLAVRRTYAMLKTTLIERSIERFGQAHKYFNRSDHAWRWPDGQVFQFGHVQHEDSIGIYLSTEYDLIGFDEVTQFTLGQYLGLRRSLRSGNNQRCRSVACTNPGGLGNDWVMERWGAWLNESHPNPAKPGELRWYVRINDKDTEVPGPEPVDHDGEVLLPLSRTYIPAQVSDNPHVSKLYRAQLQALSEPFRSQQLHGDWKVGLIEDAYQVIPRRWLRAAMDRWKPRTGDLGAGQLGVDVAAGGRDQTVVARRHGNWFDELDKTPGAQTPTGKDCLKQFLPWLAKGFNANVDAIGVGLATLEAADAAGVRSLVHGITFSEGTDETDMSGSMGFGNIRALAYWRFRELLDPDRELADGEEPPEIPPDPELFTDLTSPKFEARGGRIFIESKADIHKRIGRSPDSGDAVVLTCVPALNDFDPALYAKILREAAHKTGAPNDPA
jgi:hypothetical protein